MLVSAPKRGDLEVTSRTSNRPAPVSTAPKLASTMFGWIESPGWMTGGTSNRTTATSPSGGAIRTATLLLRLFAVSTSMIELPALAWKLRKTRPPLPGKPAGRWGSRMFWVIRTRLFWRRKGTLIVPIRMAPRREFWRGVRKTPTVDGGASAVLTAPGCRASGSIIELAPMFWTSTVTDTSLPYEASGEEVPDTIRSGSENPSGENASNCRPSRHSRAARFGRF